MAFVLSQNAPASPQKTCGEESDMGIDHAPALTAMCTICINFLVVPVKLIIYKQKKIVHVDYSSCQLQGEMLAKNIEFEKFVLRQPGDVLVLADVSDVSINSEWMASAKGIAKRSFNGKVVKGAVLGVVGIKKALLLGYNLVARPKWLPFETKKQAVEYLVAKEVGRVKR